MPRFHSFYYLLALLTFVAPAFCAEDVTPVQPDKVEKPDKKDKAEVEKKNNPAPAPAADERKKDEAAPKSAANAKQPKFPMTSEWFVNIGDTMPDDNGPNDEEDAQQVEFHPLEEAMLALQASTDEHLAESVDDEASSFKKLIREAPKYRGHIVRFRGKLETSERFPIPDNKTGLGELYRGQTTTIYGEMETFLSMERPDRDLINRPVRITGIFLKRYAFKNRLEGDKLTWTPLIIIKKVEAFSEADVAPTPMSNIAKLAIAMVVVLLLGRLAYRVVYVQGKSARGNPFTKINRRLAERKEKTVPKKTLMGAAPAKPATPPGSSAPPEPPATPPVPPSESADASAPK